VTTPDKGSYCFSVQQYSKGRNQDVRVGKEKLEEYEEGARVEQEGEDGNEEGKGIGEEE
jgi:hypothetical protein